MRWLFTLRLRRTHTYLERDRVLELYAPLSLLSLPPVWLMLVLGGYMGMYWALGVSSWYEAFRDSGSALLTLGFAPVDGVLTTMLMFSEATLGLILVALLIAYLPTMYAAFSRREALVTLLEVRAGSPPSALTMLIRFRLIHGLDHLTDMWEAWESGLPNSQRATPHYRPWRSSDHPTRACLDHRGRRSAGHRGAGPVRPGFPPNPKASLCIRAGYIALRRIADFFSLPSPPIRTSRPSRSALLAPSSTPPAPSWRATMSPSRPTGTWRGTTSRAGGDYDTVLLALCTLTTAPPAPWSSDRAPQLHLPLLQSSAVSGPQRCAVPHTAAPQACFRRRVHARMRPRMGL